MPLVAGVDCSTQSTKVVVVDVDSGRVVDSGSASHEVTGADGARETHPDVWWQALRAALAQTGRAGEISAISVAGQQHGMVVRDADERALRPAVLWNDTRSAPDARDLVDDLGGPQAWAERVGLVPVASFTATTWAWLRRVEPQVAAQVATVHLPHDDLTWRLTGRRVTDRGDASGTAWWSTETGEYAAEVLALPRVDLDVAMLPQVLGPAQDAGSVTPAAAADLGLGDDVVVGPGTGDNMGAALGMGLAPGHSAVSLGTSGTVYAVGERRAVDPSGTVAGFADATGRFLPLAATLNATLAVDRVADWLGLDREDVEDGGEVVVLPFLDGERTPNLPDAAATVVGLRHHTTPGQILRATYEGVVVSLVGALAQVESQADAAADAPIVLVGGGARGRVWRDTVRRLTGRGLVLPAGQELVALGAAAQAAAVLVGRQPLDVAAEWGHGTGERLDPLPLDEAALERHAAVRTAAAGLHDAGW